MLFIRPKLSDHLLGLVLQEQIPDVPQTLDDHATGFDAQEGVLGCGFVESRQLCVGEERVWPPDAFKHLVANTQFVRAVVESQPLVVPVLAEVEIHSEVLAPTTTPIH